jgi:hypothetical protein
VAILPGSGAPSTKLSTTVTPSGCGIPRRPVVVAHLLEVVFDLHAYRPHLPTAGLRFELRFAAVENRMPRMPECEIAARLAWSLKNVTCSPDILAARNELIRALGEEPPQSAERLSAVSAIAPSTR